MVTTTTPITEAWHAGGFMVSEARGTLSREVGTIASGQNLLAGTVLGKATLGAASVAAKAGGNTGGGTLTMDATTPIGAGAKPGIYTVRFIAAATDNGTFRVTDPDGFILGDVVMAAGGGAFNNDIKFAVADVGTDFAVGDGFNITVAAGSGKYSAYDPTAHNGLQSACAILYAPVDATSADKNATLIVRQAEVNTSELIWGANVTTGGQKTSALAQLAAQDVAGR